LLNNLKMLIYPKNTQILIIMSKNLNSSHHKLHKQHKHIQQILNSVVTIKNMIKIIKIIIQNIIM